MEQNPPFEWLQGICFERMAIQKIQLHATLVGGNQVRHLLIDFVDGSHVTNLVQLSTGSEVQLATGTRYETSQKADEWARHLEINEGYKRLPPDKPASEPLESTIALAKRLGHTVLWDNRYKTAFNLTGEVLLDDWRGMTPKGSLGYYLYALDGLHILALPTLPPDHPLNDPSRHKLEGAAFIAQYVAALETVGPAAEFVLAGRFPFSDG